MCGITGKLSLNGPDPVDFELLRQMAAMIRHLGPDDEGVFVDAPVGLASRRLTIIDLSPQGHQPMSNEDGSVWIVFNGEIYNFQGLRDDLISKGHHFRSRSDTEVVVHLYEEHGVDCLQRLRGMFAFAIWDSHNRTLFLARDRLGKKPLFYYSDGSIFLFASEPKAILLDPAVPAEPDLEAIHYYLTYQYVPSPLSAFRGFWELPPAHYLVVRDGPPLVERYSKLHYAQKIWGREQELCEDLRYRLREAARLRMISDVPLGAFLSGRIDSSSVVAFMSELSSNPVKTFSIGFEEEEYNELPYARQVACLFGTATTSLL
jgi:asparagine synthase (glutamine-hydrolysing)